MAASGDRGLSSEKFCQPISLIDRTTYSTGHEYRAKRTAGSVNQGEVTMYRTTGLISVPFCRYTAATLSTKRGSGELISLMKKFQNFLASRRAVSGWSASAVI